MTIYDSLGIGSNDDQIVYVLGSGILGPDKAGPASSYDAFLYFHHFAIAGLVVYDDDSVVGGNDDF
jgi:hypothetical protein